MQPNEQGQLGVNWTEVRSPFPFWIGTVSEAVFLIGAERNSDVVWGAAYVSIPGGFGWIMRSKLIITGTDIPKPKRVAMGTRSHLLHRRPFSGRTLYLLAHDPTAFG